jgi:stage II sporulation protein D
LIARREAAAWFATAARIALSLALGFVFAPRATRADEPGPPSQDLGRTEWLDVGIVLDAPSVLVGATSSEFVRGVPGIGDVGPGEYLLVRQEGTRTLVARADQKGREIDSPVAAFDTVWVGGPATDSMWINGVRYRGGAKVFANPRRTLTVANRVNIEGYLRGVLPYEIGKLDGATLAAGKAQAVAARTYTLSYVGRRATEGFDLYASVEDQVYGGTAAETPTTDRAVLETRGIVALSGGSYIRANYHSTCGGATVNVEDIWPDPPFPWLRQVEDGPPGEAWCKSSRHFRWTESWSGSEVLEDLNAFGPEQSGQSPPSGGWRVLEDVRVESRTPSGRVRELVFETDKGEVTVVADKVRRVLRRPKSEGGGILRSSLFKLAVEKDSRGRVSRVYASGGGNGHGAGMCQVGALAQSRAGRDYEAILRFYYSGIELVRL